MTNKAYLTLIRLLSSRDYSEVKLRTKLKERKYSAEEIDEAIALVKSQNYLNESAYVEARIKAFMSKGCSPRYIQQKLLQEDLKVEINVIEGVFNEHQKETSSQIKNLIQKKLKGPIKDYREKVKVIRFLMSKGHQLDEIQRELKQYIFEEDYL